MKRTVTISVLPVSVLLFVGIASAAPPKTTCLDRLNGRGYSCDVKDNLGNTFPDSLSVFGGTLQSSALGGGLVCECEWSGSFKRPKPNANKNRWVCVGFVDTSDPEGHYNGAATLKGNVSAKGKVSKVFGTGDSGDTYLYSCTGPIDLP